MKNADPLGQFEQLVLTAVVMLGEKAYSTAIHAKVSELAERSVAVGSITATLARLEDKGYLSSWLGEATAERGGRPKRFFRLLATGEKVLNESMRTSKRVYDGWWGKWKKRRA